MSDFFDLVGDAAVRKVLSYLEDDGKLLLIEPKGDYLDNEESKLKAKFGDAWAKAPGNPFRCFMVFDKKSPDYPGAYSYDAFMEIVKAL